MGGRAEWRATQKKNRQAKHYAMALKGINRRGGPITDLGLKRMKLQRLASGEIVPANSRNQPRVERWPCGQIKKSQVGRVYTCESRKSENRRKAYAEKKSGIKGAIPRPFGVAPGGAEWDYEKGEWVGGSPPKSKVSKSTSRKRTRSPSPPPYALSEYELERKARIKRTTRCNEDYMRAQGFDV